MLRIPPWGKNEANPPVRKGQRFSYGAWVSRARLLINGDFQEKPREVYLGVLVDRFRGMRVGSSGRTAK
jgi:hypothetical protein